METVLLRTAPADSCEQPAPTVDFVIELAPAVEHAVWHPDLPTLLVGLAPSSNLPLVTMVDALVETNPRFTRGVGATDNACRAALAQQGLLLLLRCHGGPGRGDARYPELQRWP